VVGSACRIESVSIDAACPVCSVDLSPDRAPVRYEVLSATVQSAVTPNAMVLISVLQNEMVPIAAPRNEKVQILGVRSVMARTVVILNEKARTSELRNAMVQSELVLIAATRNVTVVLRYRVVMVLMLVHSGAHCEAPPSVAVVHCAAQAPRYVAVGVRCGELQLWQAAHYAEVHSSESEPRFAAPVELVQCVRELVLASQPSLNSQVVQHDLVSIHLHSTSLAICAPAVLRLQLDFEFPCRRDLHRDLSFHAVSEQAG
jgi:hypothetical protein